MAQRIMAKKNPKTVKGVAIKKNKNQEVTVTRYGNVTSITVVSGNKRKKK